MSRDAELIAGENDSPDPDPADTPIGATSRGDAPSEQTPISPHQRRRQRRNVMLVIVVVLGCIFVGATIWSRGVLDGVVGTEVATIAPRVLFEEMCDSVKQENARTFHVQDFEVNDAMIPAIGNLDSIETLILDRGKVTDESIKTIAALPKLQHLRLRLSPIGDEGLRLLSKTSTLWYVNLPHAECTAEGVGALSAIPKLRQLRLGSRSLGNEVTREIATIESLRGIHLIGVAVTDEGLKTLAAMPHLESLYLDDSAVTEAGWDWLFREHPYLHVHIDQHHHDRDPQAHKHH